MRPGDAQNPIDLVASDLVRGTLAEGFVRTRAQGSREGIAELTWAKAFTS